MSSPTPDFSDWLAQWSPARSVLRERRGAHLDPGEILDLMAGDLGDEGLAKALGHLDSCQDCRGRVAGELAAGPEIDPDFPSLQFYWADGATLGERIDASVESDPVRGEVYHLPRLGAGARIAIEISSPRKARAEFIELRRSGWKVESPGLRLVARPPDCSTPGARFFGERIFPESDEIPTLVVALTVAPALAIIRRAIRRQPREQAWAGGAEGLIVRLIPALRDAGHAWFEALVVRFDGAESR